MNRVIFLLLALGLSGCQSFINSSSEQEGFYTWIDERGQLRTQKRAEPNTSKSTITPPNEKAVTPQTPVKQDQKALEAGSKKNNPVELDLSAFTSSTEIDQKLKDERLFSWNQDGRQNIQEVSAQKHEGSASIPNGNSFAFNQAFIHFREGKEILLSEVYGSELSLKDIYHFNKDANEDYVLIEIDIELSDLLLTTFIRDGKVAMPLVNFVNSKFFAGEDMVDYFNELTEETWSSYGSLSGKANVPAQARYILIRPNPVLGVIESSDEDITLSNLGRIQFKSP